MVRCLRPLDVQRHCSGVEEIRIYYSLIFMVTLPAEVGVVSVHA